MCDTLEPFNQTTRTSLSVSEVSRTWALVTERDSPRGGMVDHWLSAIRCPGPGLHLTPGRHGGSLTLSHQVSRICTSSQPGGMVDHWLSAIRCPGSVLHLTPGRHSGSLTLSHQVSRICTSSHPEGMVDHWLSAIRCPGPGLHLTLGRHGGSLTLSHKVSRTWISSHPGEAWWITDSQPSGVQDLYFISPRGGMVDHWLSAIRCPGPGLHLTMERHGGSLTLSHEVSRTWTSSHPGEAWWITDSQPWGVQDLDFISPWGGMVDHWLSEMRCPGPVLHLTPGRHGGSLTLSHEMSRTCTSSHPGEAWWITDSKQWGHKDGVPCAESESPASSISYLIQYPECKLLGSSTLYKRLLCPEIELHRSCVLHLSLLIQYPWMWTAWILYPESELHRSYILHLHLTDPAA